MNTEAPFTKEINEYHNGCLRGQLVLQGVLPELTLHERLLHPHYFVVGYSDTLEVGY